MCPWHHGRAPPLLGPGSIAEWSVAAADADGVDLARGAEGLVAGGGDQTRGRGGTGLAVHDSCDTQQGLLLLRGALYSRIRAQTQLQTQFTSPKHRWCLGQTPQQEQPCAAGAPRWLCLGFPCSSTLVGTKNITDLICIIYIKYCISNDAFYNWNSSSFRINCLNSYNSNAISEKISFVSIAEHV